MTETATAQSDMIQVERDGNIGWIRINRPDRLNAFCDGMRDDLEAGLAELDHNDHVRCVIVTGVGRAFSTGGDVRVMAELAESGDRDSFEELVRAGVRVVRRIDSMRAPVIAAVNGPAAGAGACLALACDIRIATETASIGFTFPSVGLHPDWGGTYYLPRLIGPSLAAEYLFTGEMIAAPRAEKLGIFNFVVENGDIEPSARALAGRIATAPVLVIRRVKKAIRRSLASSLDDILEFECEAQLEAFDSPDFREGVTAFVEKRAPHFD